MKKIFLHRARWHELDEAYVSGVNRNPARYGQHQGLWMDLFAWCQSLYNCPGTWSKMVASEPGGWGCTALEGVVCLASEEWGDRAVGMSVFFGEGEEKERL